MDEVAELRNVYEKLVAAIGSLVKFVRTQLNELGVPSVPMVSSVSTEVLLLLDATRNYQHTATYFLFFSI